MKAPPPNSSLAAVGDERTVGARCGTNACGMIPNPTARTHTGTHTHTAAVCVHACSSSAAHAHEGC